LRFFFGFVKYFIKKKNVRRKEKNPVNRNTNQGWEPIQEKYKANENTSRHNLNIQQKQIINTKKKSKNKMQRGLMITK
jgi:hypothetical protein